MRVFRHPLIWTILLASAVRIAPLAQATVTLKLATVVPANSIWDLA